MPGSRAPYRLVVVNPGHFHAALSLREAHPRLDDEVHVFAEDGPDLEAFLAIVESFNARAERPTRWRLAVHRGPDYLERLLERRPGDIAILAGKSRDKMATAKRLHEAGLHVFADKPLLIESEALAPLELALAGPPLLMEIMTGRREPANRLLCALVAEPEVFGGFRSDGGAPAIRLASTHHLYKAVNGRPLVRPAWYFDHAIAGEGMMDVTTHLVDIAQRLVGGGRAITLESARQWPTAVPRGHFRRITGLDDFPSALRTRVDDGALAYLGNAELTFRIGGVGVAVESLWGLEEPAGGGDIHLTRVCGERASLRAETSPATGFESRLTVRPRGDDSGFAEALAGAVARLQSEFPGLASLPSGDGYRLELPAPLMTTHEQHFAETLDRFIEFLDAGAMPAGEAADLIAKYRLLLEAKALSHQAGSDEAASHP